MNRPDERPARQQPSSTAKACAEKGGLDHNGYDAGKKIKGKKRHVLVDTQGLMLHAIVPRNPGPTVAVC